MTGEISICGKVKPVGGVAEKISAAIAAGADRIIVPAENRQESFEKLPVEICYVSSVFDITRLLFAKEKRDFIAV